MEPSIIWTDPTIFSSWKVAKVADEASRMPTASALANRDSHDKQNL